MSVGCGKESDGRGRKDVLHRRHVDYVASYRTKYAQRKRVELRTLQLRERAVSECVDGEGCV